MVNVRIAGKLRRAGALVAALLGGSATSSVAQSAGSLDSSFFGDGALLTGEVSGLPRDTPIVSADASGRLVVLEASPATGGAMELRRIADDGSQLVVRIAAFSSAAHYGRAITRLANGGFAVVGSVLKKSGERYLLVARLDGNLALDASFGTGGIVTRYFGGITPRSMDVAVGSDGSVYVVGGSTGSAGGQVSFLMRYAASGALAWEFPEMEFGADEALVRVLPSADGKIVLAGWTRSSSPRADSGQQVATTWFAQRRYAANGLIDGSFGSSGRTTVSWPLLEPTTLAFDVNREVLLPALTGAVRDGSGRIYLTGPVTTSYGTLPYVVRLTADGVPDAGFGSAGKLLALLGPGVGASGTTDVAIHYPVRKSPMLLLWGYRCADSEVHACSAVLEARGLDGSFYPDFGTDPTWARTPIDRQTAGLTALYYRLSLGRVALLPSSGKLYAPVQFWNDVYDTGLQPDAPPVAAAFRVSTLR